MTHDEMKELELERQKTRLLVELSGHTGSANAIGMGELYEITYGEPWEHRINDTRKLRTLVTMLRNEGTPICSNAHKNGGGYYLAAAGSELCNYHDRRKSTALKILCMIARQKKIALPEYLGQIRANLE